MAMFFAYLSCMLFALFLNSDAQSVSTSLCLWGCRDAQTCMNMNGVFHAIPTSTQSVNGRQYYVQDDRHFDQCTQVYYIYWRNDLASLGWHIGFGDGVTFDFDGTNVIGRCLDPSNLLAGGGYNRDYPGTCTIWQFFNGNTGNWEVNSDISVIEGDCPSLECAAINVDVPNTVSSVSRRYGCETAQFGTVMVQQQPYPNMFWGDGIGNGTANLVFNYKAWRWGCYANNLYNINNGVADVLPRCGGQAAGVTAYSTLDQDFNGLTDGESMTVNMDLFDGLDFDTNADVVISCVGEPSLSITLSPTTPVPTGSFTLSPTTSAPTTPAPTTPRPTTPAPTTPAPTKTIYQTLAPVTQSPTITLTSNPSRSPTTSPITAPSIAPIPSCDSSPFECSNGLVIEKYYSVEEGKCVWPRCNGDEIVSSESPTTSVATETPETSIDTNTRNPTKSPVDIFSNDGSLIGFVTAILITFALTFVQ